jgi:hypothetical protein
LHAKSHNKLRINLERGQKGGFSKHGRPCNAKTTEVYDRRNDNITVSEVECVGI